MKPINFVGPVQLTTPFEFSKRAYSFEADLQGDRKIELQLLKKLTLSAKRWVGVYNSSMNIAGQ